MAELTARQIIEEMPDNFRPERAGRANAVVQFRLTGEGGGDWYVTIKDRTCTVTPGLAETATCTLKIDDRDFIRLISGELPAMQAYTTGKLKIEGDIMKSQLIEKLFKMQG